jgi:hypothetical protein
MSDDPWKTLVKRYCPDDRQVCNCGQAWATHYGPDTEGAMVAVGKITAGDIRTRSAYVRSMPAWRCKDGCSSAQLATRDEIAIRVLRDLP